MQVRETQEKEKKEVTQSIFYSMQKVVVVTAMEYCENHDICNS